MDKLLNPTLFNGCSYLSMLVLKLILVSESNPWSGYATEIQHIYLQMFGAGLFEITNRHLQHHSLVCSDCIANWHKKRMLNNFDINGFFYWRRNYVHVSGCIGKWVNEVTSMPRPLRMTIPIKRSGRGDWTGDSYMYQHCRTNKMVIILQMILYQMHFLNNNCCSLIQCLMDFPLDSQPLPEAIWPNM